MKRVPRLRIRDRAELWAVSVEPGQPLILEGAIDHWPLLQQERGAPRARRASSSPSSSRPSSASSPSSSGAAAPLPIAGRRASRAAATTPPPPPAALPPILQRLRDLAGHRPVITSWSRRRGDGLLSYQRGARGKSWSDSRTSFAAFLDDVHAEASAPTGHVLYLQSSVLSRELPELAPLFPLELLQPEELRQSSPRLWIGSGGHRVGLHFDVDHNLHCVVAGEKRFLLYPPAALPDVYLGPLDASPAGAPTALVDPLHPDLAAFPRFAAAAAQALVAELGPGDVLALPAYWLHHVESRGLNIAVTYWWSDLPAEQRTAAAAAWAHGLLALRSLPPRWREQYRLLFEHFVFHAHGDPYAHLPPDEQGLAGVATAERTRELRDSLRKHLEASRLLEPTFDVAARYVLARHLSFRGVDHESLELVAAGGDGMIIRHELFELLRAFHAPARLADVAAAHLGLDKRGGKKAADQARRFEALCRTLVARGFLRAAPP